MSNLWLKFKIWTKVIAGLLVLIYILAFFIKNHSDPANVWIFPWHDIQTTVLYVAGISFLVGVLAALLFRTIIRTRRQIRELKERNRSVKLERAVQDMHTKAAMLRAKPVGATGTSAGETIAEKDDSTEEGE
jgi:uncharacterized integral membrane protein